jgi:hypothetical protein
MSIENLMVLLTSLTTFLSPLLPYLQKLGDKSAESVAEQIGEAAWNKAVTIWTKLNPFLASRKDMKVAIEQVSNKPDSEARQTVLKEEFEMLFRDNPELAAEILQILKDDLPPNYSNVQITQNVKNAYKSQIIGQING